MGGTAVELTLGLILLAVLAILLIVFAASKGLLGRLFKFGKSASNNVATSPEGEEPAVYDGMITVEIPVSDPQVVAYESPSQFESEIEIIKHSSRA